MAKSNTRHDGRRQARRGTDGRQKLVRAQWLRDFLSEMLTVEIGGVQLYEKALNELRHSEFEDKLTDFLHQTEYHVELCTEMLAAAAGDVDYRSAGAEAADHKARGLLSTAVPPELQDLNNIENLVLAETKDHWNWEMLSSVEKKIEDAELRSMVGKAVREVRKQEKAHLDWNERTLTTLAMETAVSAGLPGLEETEGTEGQTSSTTEGL